MSRDKKGPPLWRRRWAQVAVAVAVVFGSGFAIGAGTGTGDSCVAPVEQVQR